MPPLTGDSTADAYLAALGARARALLGTELVGAYLVGSGARGDYHPGRSDLDVALVVAGTLDVERKTRLADAFRQRAMPVPAPRLELVAYRADVARHPGPRPTFELNLNTGMAIEDRMTVDPADEPWFWFLLDLDAAADAAMVIEGAPAGAVFGAARPADVRDALRTSLAWHATHDEAAPNRVLIACRAWCWVVTGRWSSKTVAAGWAIDAGADRGLVEHALALREGTRSDPLHPDRVRALSRSVAAIVDNRRMKITVIGASGLIGTKVVQRLRDDGRQVVASSRSSGVDVLTGDGLAEALAGADALVDVTNSPSFEADAVMAFFTTSATNIASAAKSAGVGHYVALSIVGVDGLPESGYMRAKVAQERVIRESGVAYSIVRATQFAEFADAIVDSMRSDGEVRVPDALIQPVAADDVAAEVARVAAGPPLNGIVTIGGPKKIPFEQLARDVLDRSGETTPIVVDPDVRYFGTPLATTSLVTGD